jgi:hypothetical protein
LKSIGGGLAPAILNGPLGCGGVVIPFRRHIYYPPSLDETISWLEDSLSDDGSNLTLTPTSIPSKLSVAGALTVAVSTVKSLVTTGALAFGSTFTGCF